MAIVLFLWWLLRCIKCIEHYHVAIVIITLLPWWFSCFYGVFYVVMVMISLSWWLYHCQWLYRCHGDYIVVMVIISLSWRLFRFHDAEITWKWHMSIKYHVMVRSLRVPMMCTTVGLNFHFFGKSNARSLQGRRQAGIRANFVNFWH